VYIGEAFILSSISPFRDDTVENDPFTLPGSPKANLVSIAKALFKGSPEPELGYLLFKLARYVGWLLGVAVF
jgi:hypothetical protein